MDAIDRELTKQSKSAKHRSYPKNCSITESKIMSQICENTGIAGMDSGGDDGRHWQKNCKVKDFRKVPRAQYSIREGSEYCELYVSLFHAMSDQLEYTEASKQIQKELYDFSRTIEQKDNPWYGIIEDFIERGGEDFNYAFDGINGESVLDQGIMAYNYHGFMIVQTHNGADIRGGYSNPVVYEGDFYEPWYKLECDCTHTEDTQSNFPDSWITKPKTPKSDRWDYVLFCKDCETEVIAS